MIIDKLENAPKYYSLGANIKKGLLYLQQTDFVNESLGKKIIDGEKVWANVQEVQTKDETTTLWEVHRCYTDIQYVISGCEKMCWANLDAFMPDGEFDDENDIQFGQIKDKNANATLIVPQGYFVIFTSQDVHKPALKVGLSQIVKKVVVKVEQ